MWHPEARPTPRKSWPSSRRRVSTKGSDAEGRLRIKKMIPRRRSEHASRRRLRFAKSSISHERRRLGRVRGSRPGSVGMPLRRVAAAGHPTILRRACHRRGLHPVRLQISTQPRPAAADGAVARTRRSLRERCGRVDRRAKRQLPLKPARRSQPLPGAAGAVGDARAGKPIRTQDSRARMPRPIVHQVDDADVRAMQARPNDPSRWRSR